MPEKKVSFHCSSTHPTRWPN